MAEKHVIAVAGATGGQGGSVVDALLESGRYAVRALTRDATSAKAKALAARGCEVVAADLDKPETLEPALKGAYGLFLVTNFWEHLNALREVEQVRHAAQAAKAAKVHHIVWSTLMDTESLITARKLDLPKLPSGGELFYVPHFDGKARANRELEGLPTTFLNLTMFWDLFTYSMKPSNGVITMPMDKALATGISYENIGRVVRAILDDPKKFIGKHVYGCDDIYTLDEVARIMSEVTGHKVEYKPMTPEAFGKLGFPGADDLANMFSYYIGCADDIVPLMKTGRDNFPEMITLRQWMEAHKAELIKALK